MEWVMGAIIVGLIWICGYLITELIDTKTGTKKAAHHAICSNCRDECETCQSHLKEACFIPYREESMFVSQAMVVQPTEDPVAVRKAELVSESEIEDLRLEVALKDALATQRMKGTVVVKTIEEFMQAARKADVLVAETREGGEFERVYTPIIADQLLKRTGQKMADHIGLGGLDYGSSIELNPLGAPVIELARQIPIEEPVKVETETSPEVPKDPEYELRIG